MKVTGGRKEEEGESIESVGERGRNGTRGDCKGGSMKGKDAKQPDTYLVGALSRDKSMLAIELLISVIGCIGAVSCNVAISTASSSMPQEMLSTRRGLTVADMGGATTSCGRTS